MDYIRDYYNAGDSGRQYGAKVTMTFVKRRSYGVLISMVLLLGGLIWLAGK